jgi:hypothetical protein
MKTHPDKEDEEGMATSPEATSIFKVDLKGILSKKFMPFSQKAAVLTLLEADLDLNGCLSVEEIEKAEELVKNIKESMLNTFANVGVVSALIGITTYAAILNPLSPAPIDGSPTVQVDLYRTYTILNMISTCFSLNAIFLCTFYNPDCAANDHGRCRMVSSPCPGRGDL